MKILIILNDPPYGTERSYNGLRLAKSLIPEKAEVTLFLLSDAVSCARQGQKVPEGFYNTELMLKSVLRTGRVLLCGACLDARGIRDEDLVQGAERSTMKTLAEQTLAADKVLVF
ncbi:DsrE/DsrF/TusD sulfur relay family protein [Thiolapillus sp.]